MHDSSTGNRGFLVSFDVNGNIIWQKGMGGTQAAITGITMDDSGNIWCAGTNKFSGNQAGIIFKLNSNGDYLAQREIAIDPVQSFTGAKITSLRLVGNNLFFGGSFFVPNQTSQVFAMVGLLPSDLTLTGEYFNNSISIYSPYLANYAYATVNLPQAATTYSLTDVSFSITTDSISFSNLIIVENNISAGTEYKAFPSPHWTLKVGSNNNYCRQITVDIFNNIYALIKSTYILTLSKYTQEGDLVWTRNISNNFSQVGSLGAVKTDSSGNIYIAGSFGNQGYIAKFDSSGNIQWAKHNSPQNVNSYHNMAIDSSANLYTVGTTTNYPGFENILLVKYDSSGNLLWAKYVATLQGESDNGYGVDVDASGNIYVSGSIRVSTFDTGQFSILKLDSNGALLWGKFLGLTTGTNLDYARGCIVNSSGVYVAGYSFSEGSSVPVMVLVKYDTSGTLQWKKKLDDGNTSNSKYFFNIVYDRNFNIYVIGYTVNSGVYSNNIAKFDTSGNLIWHRRLSHGATYEFSEAIAVNYSDVFIGGTAGNAAMIARLPNDGFLTGTYNNGVSYTNIEGSFTLSDATITETSASISISNASSIVNNDAINSYNITTTALPSVTKTLLTA